MIATLIGWRRLILVFAVVMQIANDIFVSFRLQCGTGSPLKSDISTLDGLPSARKVSRKEEQHDEPKKKTNKEGFFFGLVPFSLLWPLVSVARQTSTAEVVYWVYAVTWEIPPRDVWCKQQWLTAKRTNQRADPRPERSRWPWCKHGGKRRCSIPYLIR